MFTSFDSIFMVPVCSADEQFNAQLYSCIACPDGSKSVSF